MAGLGSGDAQLVAKRIVLLAVIAVLSACSASPESVLDDYAQRVARVLNVELDAEQSLDPLPKLRIQDNHIEVHATQINLLDFLRLSSCELSRVIGQRNSSLGKLALPSQRLHMERDFLLLGPVCVQQLAQTQPELAETLASALVAKRAERMDSWWNAWFTGHEWQSLISPATQPVPIAPASADNLDIALQVFDYLLQQGNRWQGQQFDYDDTEMELQQQQWLLSEAIGQWLQSQRLLTRVNNQVAELLEYRTNVKSLCLVGRSTPAADILNNVFYKYYAGVLQPYMSRVDRFGTAIMLDLNAVRTLVPVPDAYLTWLQQVSVERDKLTRSHQRHVKAWQGILSQCGLMPTGANGASHLSDN